MSRSGREWAGGSGMVGVKVGVGGSEWVWGFGAPSLQEGVGVGGWEGGSDGAWAG